MYNAMYIVHLTMYIIIYLLCTNYVHAMYINKNIYAMYIVQLTMYIIIYLQCTIYVHAMYIKQNVYAMYIVNLTMYIIMYLQCTNDVHAMYINKNVYAMHIVNLTMYIICTSNVQMMYMQYTLKKMYIKSTFNNNVSHNVHFDFFRCTWKCRSNVHQMQFSDRSHVH